MTDHNCPHTALIKQSHKELFGNGNVGMVKEFVKLNTEFREMNENVDKLATAFSALAKNDSNREAVRMALGKALIKASIIIASAGTIITLILKLT